MADNQETVNASPQSTELPAAAIVCIAIGAYLVFIVIVLLIRQILLKRGICQEGCQWCGKEGQLQCCECCMSCSESCNCGTPSLQACFNPCCPNRRQLDCADIVMCQCWSDPDNQCCNSQEPLCDCGNCDCTCNCQPPECQNINCCCFMINLKNEMEDDYRGTGMPGGYTLPGYPMAPGVAMPLDPNATWQTGISNTMMGTGASVNWEGAMAHSGNWQHDPFRGQSSLRAQSSLRGYSSPHGSMRSPQPGPATPRGLSPTGPARGPRGRTARDPPPAMRASPSPLPF